jgi:hypothetical protein
MIGIWAVAAAVAIVGMSYLVEAARGRPVPPSRLGWWSVAPAESVDVDGVRLRYLVAGDGPPLVPAGAAAVRRRGLVA